MLSVDDIRGAVDEPVPATCGNQPEFGPPPEGLTASRADLVIWWRWRYSTLKAENARLAAQLDQVLNEAQGYRALLQAALDTQHEQGHRHDRLRDQHHRLRDEYRNHRKRVIGADQQQHGRRTAA